MLRTYLDEPDILALLSEALPADIEAVFPDQTGFVGADTTMGEEKINSALTD
jgi:hypothetical protein